MSKKLILIVSALLLAASLCACNNEEKPNEDNTINNNAGGSANETVDGTEDESNDETAEQVGPGIVDENPEDLTYTDKDDTVYILHPNGAVKLHGSDDVADTSLANGTELKRTGINEANGWSRVEHNETTYYVVTSCLTTLADLDADFTTVNKVAVLADGVASLNVRNAPSMDNHIVGYVYEETNIVIVAENTADGWYKVEFTPYGSDKVAYGYIVSDAKWFASVADVTVENATDEAATETTTEAE